MAGPSAAASRPVVAEVALGYLTVPAFFAYAVTFYRLALGAGWWLPSSSLSDPNVVAMYQPWFSPLAAAFSAGVLEEALFRVIPIAGSTLLYRRFLASGTDAERSVAQPVWWWFAATQLVQAVIFGAAHANCKHPQIQTLCYFVIFRASLFRASLLREFVGVQTLPR